MLHGTFLGLFEGAVHLLSDPAIKDDADDAADDSALPKVNPRRRARRDVGNLVGESPFSEDEIEQSVDPDRFAGLADEFLWKESVVITPKKHWYQEYAAEVAGLRAKGMTHEQLASHFGKTVPTIRKALKAAPPELLALLRRKMPRARWTDEHALEVANLKAGGMTTKEIATKFGKSDTTIRAALHHAKNIAA